MSTPLVEEGHKRVLLVLFIPSADRDGQALSGQDEWVNQALSALGTLFGGATAYPKAQGVWRDDERDGALVFDEPVVMHCYTTPEDIEDEAKLRKLASFCLSSHGQRDQPRRGRIGHRRRIHRHPKSERGVSHEAAAEHGQDREGVGR